MPVLALRGFWEKEGLNKAGGVLAPGALDWQQGRGRHLLLGGPVFRSKVAANLRFKTSLLSSFTNAPSLSPSSPAGSQWEFYRT